MRNSLVDIPASTSPLTPALASSKALISRWIHPRMRSGLSRCLPARTRCFPHIKEENAARQKTGGNSRCSLCLCYALMEALISTRPSISTPAILTHAKLKMCIVLLRKIPLQKQRISLKRMIIWFCTAYELTAFDKRLLQAFDLCWRKK